MTFVARPMAIQTRRSTTTIPRTFMLGENDAGPLGAAQALEFDPRDRPRRSDARRERGVLAAALGEGTVARVTDLGRLGARLAVLAGYDSRVRVRGGLALAPVEILSE